LPKQSIKQLKNEIYSCTQCTRLVEYREYVYQKRPIRFNNDKYWNKPIYGFGDPAAELLIIGSAPAAHGANRTGRVFTGDRSSDFLMKSLNKFGLCNISTSKNIDDGLILNRTYITDIIRCAPPNDKPTKEEIFNCSKYLNAELASLTNLKIVLTLGKVAFDNYLKTISYIHDQKYTGKFSHGQSYNLSDTLPLIIASYHPSPRNTNTGRLNEQQFNELIASIVARLKK
jgi:uracil-DNA glycosylase family 4|tara:strand:+ start:1581 stop:2267 length:687 start_codon:yes stop_codon:yes gene_type:complete